MEKDKKNYLWIIIVLLLIIIVILLFFSRFGKITHESLKPTGNVDVFDIDVKCLCLDKNNCDTEEEKEYTLDSLPVFNESNHKSVLGSVFVDDKNGNYIYQQNLNIFENAAYEYTTKIAPGVSNVYHFVVHNSMNINVKYYLKMYEETEYKVNLKYRLKRENSYVVGDDNTWVSAEELETNFKKLDIKSSDAYALEWKWEYEDGKDDEDTQAGKKMTSTYKLNIRFYFEAV